MTYNVFGWDVKPCSAQILQFKCIVQVVVQYLCITVWMFTFQEIAVPNKNDTPRHEYICRQKTYEQIIIL